MQEQKSDNTDRVPSLMQLAIYTIIDNVDGSACDRLSPKNPKQLFLFLILFA
jgi:F0F1-type ATP synthase membrane subunit a